MKLDCVFTAVNENELYLDFIPIFIKTWNKLYPDVDVKIVLIAKDIPEDLILYKNNIILFNPIEDVLTSFTSQFIRLLYPCILDYKNGVLITDIDMLPMNSTYYTKNIVEFDNNKFIYYRNNVCFEYKQIAMCYNVATPKIWKDIFKVNSIDDIANVIKETFIKNTIKEGHGNTGWCSDQITLYNKIMEWNKKTNNFIRLKENQTLFKRLDRNTFDISNVNIRENITSGKYTDYHCYRPMSKYSKINWEVFNLLPSAYSKLPFIKSELKSPIGNGLFEILINTKENILYKKNKKKINIINIENYKKIIYGIKSDPVLCEYIFEPEKIYIEDDGSYYSSFIKNSIRLYDINSNSRIDDTILDNLKRSIQDMKKKLNEYVKTNKLSGDWALHNLIYCLDTNKIYNVDLEGFYTYPLIHNNGNCDINYCNERFDELLDIIENNLENKNIKTRKDSYNHILDIIRYVKDSGKAYSAKHIDIGYHSIKIDGIYHKGQRDCIKRLEFCKEEYDFTNKNVLDVGCCIGGMLFPLSSEINYGCGIDFNYRNINAGNAIKQYTKTDNLSFYIFDLDKEELQFIKNFIPQIDVVFLYSVCMWIKKWKGLIDFISLNSKVLFIETNGSQFQQLEQINYCKLKFKIIKQIYDKSLDDKGQHNRKLYICKN